MNLDNIKLEPILDSVQLLRLTDDEYFSSNYDNYISNSRLKLIDPEKDGTPEKFFAGFAGNRIYSDSLIFGSAIHTYILQNSLYDICESVNRPSSKAGFIADLVYNKQGLLPDNSEIFNACVEVDYYKGNPTRTQFEALRNKIIPYLVSRYEYEHNLPKDAKEPIYLDEKGRERFHECVNNITANPYIQNLLHPMSLLEPVESMNEWAVLLDIEVTVDNGEPFIIKLKSKLDNFTIDKENNLITINDLKTHGGMLDTFDDAINNFSYDRELAFYSLMIKHVAKKYYNLDNPNIKGNFLVVSTVPNYYSKVVRMTRDMFYKGFCDLTRLLKMVCYCKYYEISRTEAVIY